MIFLSVNEIQILEKHEYNGQFQKGEQGTFIQQSKLQFAQNIYPNAIIFNITTYFKYIKNDKNMEQI